MTTLVPVAVSPLRQRLIDEMDIRRFGHETQRNYIRDVGRFATFLGRSPDTATAEDVRRFQIEQGELDVPAPTMNAIVSALRFFFTQTLDRPDLARKLVRMRHERKLPVVLSRDEVARLLDATTCLKHQAALSVAYGAGLRAAEVAALKVRDIDSERMLLRVERGKGGRYRNAMLPTGLLALLREWWRVGRREGVLHVDGWLFPGQHYLKPLSTRQLHRIVVEASVAAGTHALGLSFDVVLLSAVWQHVVPGDRRRAFRKLATLLKPGGLLVMTLRLGPAPVDRPMHEVSLGEVEGLAREYGLMVARSEHRAGDARRRPGVDWITVAMRLPDDGAGALPLLRGIILNDDKSATYKLGLLRSVAKVADLTPGLARHHPTEDAVLLPLGVVALNWVRMYLPLVSRGLPQMPRNSGPDGLGFAKDGFRALMASGLASLDLRVGAAFSSERAAAVSGAMREAARTIATMPANFTRYLNSSTSVFATTASAPNRVWLADITCIATGEGWLYLAAVLDLATRRIVGWAEQPRVPAMRRIVGMAAEGMRDHMRTAPPLAALMMAARRRQPAPGLICHWDRGSQYAAGAYGDYLAVIGAVPSMSRTANCYDNAPMESFFHTLKVELVHQCRWATQAEAPGAVRIHPGLLRSTPHARSPRVSYA